MKIDCRLIAAVGRSGQLGLGGKLPWSDPLDLRWFRDQTMDSVVLMGGRTHDKVGQLPGRFRARWSGKTSPYAVLQQIHVRFKGLTIWVAGGAYTYAAFMPFVRYAVITRIDYDGEADTFMPPLWGGSYDIGNTRVDVSAVPQPAKPRGAGASAKAHKDISRDTPSHHSSLHRPFRKK
jgi:dihydromethanopterin reductase